MIRLLPPPSTYTVSAKKEKKCSDEAKAAAIAAAEAAEPRCYTLTGFKNPGCVNFIAFGCQGSGDNNQKLVAQMIYDQIKANPEDEPDFILLLGDNIYPEGAKSPRSRKFDTSFYEPYAALIEEFNIPFFVITGNHDYNMRDESYYLPLLQRSGPQRVLSEVAHTYLPDDKYDIASKIALFQQNTLNLKNKLPFWNMPKEIYILNLEKYNTWIICLDSSVYIDAYLTKESGAENNQALWLEKITKIANEANIQCILALHHAIYSPGKRSFKKDLHLYLSKEQRKAIRHHFPELDKHTTPYNNYLAACFKAQGLIFALILSAHDHQLYYYNNGDIKQLTLGGGGGPLQNRYEFTEPLSFFIKDFGFGSVRIDREKPQSLEFAIHTRHNRHFLFSSQSKTALKSQADEPRVLALKNGIQLAVTNYFDFMAKKQNEERTNFVEWNKKHGHHDNNLVHKAWALTTEDKAHTFEELTKQLETIINKTSQSAEHSFKNYLAAALSDSQDEEITALLSSPSRKRTCALQ